MNLTMDKIKTALVSAGIPPALQEKLLDELQAVDSEPAPLTQLEMRQLLSFMERGELHRFPAHRLSYAKQQLTSLFSAADAFREAEQAFAKEMSNLDKILTAAGY